jgi:HEAT repeat protein
MPLIRKPADSPSVQKRADGEILESLVHPNSDERWAAARDAASVAGGGAALVAALPREADPRVREAMFTSLARIGTPAAADAVISLLRSDDANLRGGALDALRIMVPQVHELLPQLLIDRDTDIRILSCELARVLEGAEATRLLCRVLDQDTEANVCAAAVEVLAEVAGPQALPSLQACALKFGSTPFLAFAIQVVIERLNSEASATRA